jgi:hypothetical protein
MGQNDRSHSMRPRIGNDQQPQEDKIIFLANSF